MTQAKTSNLTLISGPQRFVEGSYHAIPVQLVYHYTFKKVGKNVFVANVAVPEKVSSKLTLAQLAAKFPNKTLDSLFKELTSKKGWTRATQEQVDQYQHIKDKHDKYCLQVFAQRAKRLIVSNKSRVKVFQDKIKSTAAQTAALTSKLENLSSGKITITSRTL